MREIRTYQGTYTEWLLDGAVVSNARDILREWAPAKRPSPAKWEKGRREALWAQSEEEAIAYMSKRHALAIVFEGRPWPVGGPFPTGCVFYQLDVQGQRSAVIPMHARSLTEGRRAFIGDQFYQDGAKFYGATYDPKDPSVLVIARKWVPKIAAAFDAETRFLGTVLDAPT